ncbi:MAG: macro domain-containing protein [Bacteroidales bacterium]
MKEETQATCVVIMPFGKKENINGEIIDFNQIYKEIIQEPIRAAGLKPLRCDEIEKAGSIHRDMFEHIAQDDVAIVDLTNLNANVFYELGVRHALKNNVTVLIQATGTNIPFNIQGLRIIQYPAPGGDYSETRTLITRFIINGINNKETDSPVAEVLENLKIEDKRKAINEIKKYNYRLKANKEKKISVITGDIIEHPEKIDIWVNSENTNMQMARYFDRSFSAIVRYNGARKDENEDIIEDTIALKLAEAKGNRETVNPFTVLVTDSGALEQSHGVKKIFHIAATIGVPGVGWAAIRPVHTSVSKCLRIADARKEELKSILFPMLGTGIGGLDVYEVAPQLIKTAISYLIANPDSQIKTIYFTAWNGRDLEACIDALDDTYEVEVDV